MSELNGIGTHFATSGSRVLEWRKSSLKSILSESSTRIGMEAKMAFLTSRSRMLEPPMVTEMAAVTFEAVADRFTSMSRSESADPTPKIYSTARKVCTYCFWTGDGI